MTINDQYEKDGFVGTRSTQPHTETEWQPIATVPTDQRRIELKYKEGVAQLWANPEAKGTFQAYYTHWRYVSALPQTANVLADVLAAELGDTYSCTREWSAWGYGTMTQDDFEPAEERAAEIADTIIRRFPHITTPQATVAAFKAERDEAQLLVRVMTGELHEAGQRAETAKASLADKTMDLEFMTKSRNKWQARAHQLETDIAECQREKEGLRSTDVLPCDVKVNSTIFRKGVSFSVVCKALQRIAALPPENGGENHG